MQWSRHHDNSSIVAEMLVHVTKAGGVDSPAMSVLAFIDDEPVGQSRAQPVGRASTADFLIPLDFRRASAAQPKPVGVGVLELRVIAPSGAVIARFPELSG
jgi:hypothetical protein